MKSIKLPLFEGKIEIFTTEEALIKRALQKGIIKGMNVEKEIRTLKETVYGVIYYETKNDLVILAYLPEEYDDVLVSHEIIHMINVFYKYYDLPSPKIGKDEVYCRYHDHIMQEIKKKVYKK